MPDFIHKGRVAFHETDAAGIVHFSNYFRYAEEAECAALASLGVFSAKTLEVYSFPRVQAQAQYNRSLRFAEVYTVRAFIKRIGRSSLTWRFEIGGYKKSCATVDVTSVRCSVQDGRPAPYSLQEVTILSQLMREPTEPDDKPQS